MQPSPPYVHFANCLLVDDCWPSYTHASRWLESTPLAKIPHTVARIKKDDFIGVRNFVHGASGCDGTLCISFPGRAKLPWSLLLRSLEVVPIGSGWCPDRSLLRDVCWVRPWPGCLRRCRPGSKCSNNSLVLKNGPCGNFAKALAQYDLPCWMVTGGCDWVMILVSGRCSVATANGFESHYFENGQAIESFTSLAFIFSKRGLIFHRMPYRFSAWISGKVWPFWFSSAQIVWGHLFDKFVWLLFKILVAALVPRFSPVSSLYLQFVSLACAWSVHGSIYDFQFFFAVQSAWPPQKTPLSRFEDNNLKSRQYRDFAPKNLAHLRVALFPYPLWI